MIIFVTLEGGRDGAGTEVIESINDLSVSYNKIIINPTQKVRSRVLKSRNKMSVARTSYYCVPSSHPRYPSEYGREKTLKCLLSNFTFLEFNADFWLRNGLNIDHKYPPLLCLLILLRSLKSQCTKKVSSKAILCHNLWF